MASHPARFSVQRAAGPKWKTIHLEEDDRKAFKVLKEVIRVNPRGYFRLIRLDYNKERSDHANMEFDWKLLELYDPKQGGFQKGYVPEGPPLPDTPAGVGGASRAKSGQAAAGEKVKPPLHLYVIACVLGLILAVLLTVLYGPDLVGNNPID